MREAQALKEKVDAARQKEAMLKKRIQPWLDEAFMASSNIEGMLTHKQVASEPRKAMKSNIYTSVARIEWVKQMADDFFAMVSEAQKFLNDLSANISTPAK